MVRHVMVRHVMVRPHPTAWEPCVPHGRSTFLREDDDPLSERFLPRSLRGLDSVLRAAREHPGDDADRADDGEHQRHTAGRSEQLDDAAQQ